MVVARKKPGSALAKKAVMGPFAKKVARALVPGVAATKPASDLMIDLTDASEQDEKHLKTITNPSTKFEAFNAAVAELSDVNLVATMHGQWLCDIVHKDFAAKLELLLDAGLDPDTYGLLFASVNGSGECLNLLLDRGADPLGNQAVGKCTFVAAADEGNPGRLEQTAKLKAALQAHPKYKKKGRPQQEWEAAVKRMYAALLKEHGASDYELCCKWLQDSLLTRIP